MPALTEIQTNIQPPEIFLGLDEETYLILNSDPRKLLNYIFLNDEKNPFLLKETGFDMAMQALRWINKTRNAIENNTSLETANKQFIDETIQDVVGFYFEYLTNQDIFPISVEFGINQNGKRDVIATKYNQPFREINENLRILTGQVEREGALEDGINKAIDMILEAGENTIIILNSPSGWSGLKRDGKEILYPDNQTYVYWIDRNKDLQGITVRSDIDIDSGEKIAGKNNKNISLKERIKEVVRSPISKSISTLEDIIDILEEASGKKFSKQRGELRNKGKLFELNDEALLIINNLKESLLKNISHLSLENIKAYINTVGKAILDLSYFTLTPQTPKEDIMYSYQPFRSIEDSFYPPPDYDYSRLAEELQKRGGCNGGGNNTKSTITANFGVHQTEISKMEKGPKRFCSTCEGLVDTIVVNGETYCSLCGEHLGSI